MGQAGKELSFKGSTFHRIIPQFMIQMSGLHQGAHAPGGATTARGDPLLLALLPCRAAAVALATRAQCTLAFACCTNANHPRSRLTRNCHSLRSLLPRSLWARTVATSPGECTCLRGLSACMLHLL